MGSTYRADIIMDHRGRAPGRRAVLCGIGAAGLLAGCGNGVGAGGADIIDARVERTLAFMYASYPSSRDLADKSSALLVMPLVTEASFGLGGSYGRGALVVGGATVDYYSAAQATVGIQIGAQQYAHVLFFITDAALQDFRISSGFAAGADVEYVINDRGFNAGADTVTTLTPVIGAVFGQSGVLAGASIEGTKYTRIIP